MLPGCDLRNVNLGNSPDSSRKKKKKKKKERNGIFSSFTATGDNNRLLQTA